MCREVEIQQSSLPSAICAAEHEVGQARWCATLNLKPACARACNGIPIPVTTMKRPGESPTKRSAHINDSSAQAKGSCAKKAGQNRCLDKVASGQEARSWPRKTLPGSLAHTQTKISRTTNRSSLPFPCLSICTSNTGKQGTV